MEPLTNTISVVYDTKEFSSMVFSIISDVLTKVMVAFGSSLIRYRVVKYGDFHEYKLEGHTESWHRR